MHGTRLSAFTFGYMVVMLRGHIAVPLCSTGTYSPLLMRCITAQRFPNFYWVSAHIAKGTVGGCRRYTPPASVIPTNRSRGEASMAYHVEINIGDVNLNLLLIGIGAALMSVRWLWRRFLRLWKRKL